MKEHMVPQPNMPKSDTQVRQSERASGSFEIAKPSPRTSNLWSELLKNDPVSLTQPGVTSYAKDGEIVIMSDIKGGDSTPRIEEHHSEVNKSEQHLVEMFNQQITPDLHAIAGRRPDSAVQRTGDILTRTSDYIKDPEIKEEVQHFEKAREKNPLSDEKKWPTKRLQNEYLRLHGISFLSKFKAKLGLLEGRSESDHKAVDLQPYTQLVMGELIYRGEDVRDLFSEVMEFETEVTKLASAGDTSLLDRLRIIIHAYKNEDEDKEQREKPARSEVFQNAALSEKDRLQKAGEILRSSEEISEDSRLGEAILKSHKIGEGEKGKDGNDAGVYNFTTGQLLRKARALHEGGITDPGERRKLMEAGIVGTGDAFDAMDSDDISSTPLAQQRMAEMAALDDHTGFGGGGGGGRTDGKDNEFMLPGETRLVEGLVTYDSYGQVKVDCIEKLAMEIMANEKVEDFRTGGKYELLKVVKNPITNEVEYVDLPEPKRNARGQIVTDENGQPIMKEKKVEFQPQNFLRWVRHWLSYYHNEDPDGTDTNFRQAIGLHRDYGGVALGTMLDNDGRYFRSWAEKEVKYEDGTVKVVNQPVYKELVEQIKRELWIFSASRQTDIKYREIMGDDEKLPQTISGLFYGNTFTKMVWGNKSTLYWMMTVPADFKGIATSEGDVKIGQAINYAREIYYNIADREKLEELLGENAPLLNPTAVRNEVRKMQNVALGPTDKDVFVDPKELAKLDIKESLIKFINIFNAAGKPPIVIKAIRNLVNQSIAKKYQLYEKNEDGSFKTQKDENGNEVPIIDTNSVDYVDIIAGSMWRWTGAASKNDVGAQGYDAWTRVQVTDEYRDKQTDPKRGGAYGNPKTMKFIKQLAPDLFNGITVLAGEEWGDKNKTWTHKLASEVLDNMQKAESEEEYKKRASELVFPENTMRNFANDMLGRAFKIFGQLQSGEEIKLDKFTHYDITHGLSFDRAAFEDALKEKFFKPMRYAYSTYGGLNFAKMIRSDAGEGKFEDMHLGEAMFGREIIENATFKNKDGKIVRLVKQDMKDIPIDAKGDLWRQKIDWDAVNSLDGKAALWRQFALARIAAEFNIHRDHHSRDPKYGFMYYEQALMALESIPDSILGDDTSLKGVSEHGSFFTDEDLRWLRRSSDTERWKLILYQLHLDLVPGTLKGLKEGWKAFAKASFKI